MLLSLRGLWDTTPKVDPGRLLQRSWMGWYLLALPLAFLAGRLSKTPKRVR